MGMGSRVPVDDFSVMTGLSRDELRQYRDLGILDPWHTDAHTGYRLYDTTQVHVAHTIRGLRAGGMAIADLKSLLCADDLNWRNTHIAAQQSDVWSALGPVKPTRARVHISLRREAPMSAWAVTATVSKPDLAEWITESLQTLSKACHALGVRTAGPCAALLERELFTQQVGQVRFLMPVGDAPPPPEGINSYTLPPIDVAVVVHRGRRDGIDRSYGVLGAYVSDRLEGDEGPIREYYLDGAAAIGSGRTEICWPIFDTAAQCAVAPPSRTSSRAGGGELGSVACGC